MYKTFLVNFNKGLRQKGSPRFFKDGECSIVQDVYLDEDGNVYSRKFINLIREYSYQIKTIFPYKNNYIISLNNGDLYKNDILIDSSLGGNKFSCVEYNDILYLVNSKFKKRYDNTNLHNIGNVKPSTVPTCSVSNLELTDCNTVFTAGANVISSVDEHDYQVNPDDTTDIKSAKFVIDALFTTGVIGYYDITSIDISSYTHVGLWIKANADIKAGVLELLLDNTSGCVSPLETIDIPVLNINEWQWVVLELDDPSLLTAVISVGLNANSDPGVVDVHLDRIIAMNSGNLDGAYYYKYTYVDSNGKESRPSSASVVINPKDEIVSVGVVASSVSKVSYINLYRLGGTLTDWYYVTQVANTTQTITDDNADSDLTTLFDADNNDPPESGLSFIVEHYERLIGAKTTDYLNSVQYTVEYEPEYWGNALNQQYLISNKDECTGLMSWGRYIIFCKKDKIFVLEGSDPTTWHKRKSDSSYGNIAPWALTFYKVPIFVSNGLYFFNGNNEQVFSNKIKDFFKDKELKNSISGIYDDKLYLSLPDIDTVLIYDFILKIFYTYDLKLSEIYKNYAGNDTDLVLIEQDINRNDYDTINFKIKSKAYALNDIPNEIGSIRNLIIPIDTKNDNITLNIYIDKDLKQSLSFSTDSMTRKRISTGSILKGRYVEFEFIYTGKKQIKIEPPIIVNPDV
jgi:hypothetical protein